MAAEVEDRPSLIVSNRFALLAATMLAVIMQALDTTIANVALPHMQASLSATQDTVTWILTSYVLATAVALPMTGWLVARVGTKQLLVVSVTLFTVASILCGMAQNMTEMVLFRVFQGVAGAFLAPLGQTIILDVSTTAERPRMMTIFTQVVLIGPIAGPVIGGYLTDNFDWRWVFFVNVPVGAICVLLLLFYMPATARRPRQFDLLGWVLVSMAVCGVQLMLDRGAQLDWFASGEIVIYLVVSLCAGWMFVVHVLTARQPLFPRAIFADANFVTALIIATFFGVVLMSTMALLPTLIQNIYGYPPLEAGLLLTPRGVGMMISMLLFGKFIARGDARFLLAAGFVILGTSLLMMSRWAVDMPLWPIVLTGVLQGFGMSISYVPLNLIAFATLPAELRTDAIGALNLVRNMGSSVGITLCTVFLSRTVQISHAELGERLHPSGLPFAFDRLDAFGNATATVLRVADALVNRQAAMIAYNNDFLALGITSFIMVPLLLFVRKPKPTASTTEAMPEAGH